MNKKELLKELEELKDKCFDLDLTDRFTQYQQELRSKYNKQIIELQYKITLLEKGELNNERN